jgi:hypothetical protein
VGYGYRKIRVLLKRGGWSVRKKLAGCIEKEGLALRYKPRRRRCAATNRRASQVTATFENTTERLTERKKGASQEAYNGR